jgi:hypothetical protein
MARERRAAQPRVCDTAGASAFASGDHPRSDRLRRLTGRCRRELIERDARDAHVEIDAIEQRAGELRSVTLHGGVIDATSANRAGNVHVPFVREIVTAPSSSGPRSTSSVERGISAISSR